MKTGMKLRERDLTQVLTRVLARVTARPRTTLAICFGLAALTAALASRLELRTAFTELLPSDDPAVVNLERTQSRVGDLNLLLVGIRSPDHAANLRYADALSRALQALPKEVCEIATYHVQDVRAFLERNRWLYLTEDELTELRDHLRAELTKRKNPFAVDLESDGASTHEALLEKAKTRRGFLDDRFPDGNFVLGDYTWVATLPPGGLVAENAGQSIIDAVKAFVAKHPPAQFHPQMTIVPAGPVQSGIQNREAVERDIVSVTLFCVLVIGLSLAIYFRSLLWVIFVVAPAVLGALFAFATAALAFGYLNSSTAFLGSIILGNGINHAIVLGARYREQRSLGLATEAAISKAAAGVGASTLAAALAAAVAYVSLTLTSFRGFSQFGLMGAVGCLCCWAATFVVLPALVMLVDRRPAAARPPARPGVLGALVTRHAATVVLGGVVLALSAVLGLRHFLDRPFEYDFRRLSTDVDHDDTYRQFDQNLDALFGMWHSPTVLLADRLDQVEPMRRAIRRQDRGGDGQPGARQDPTKPPYIGRVVTVYDVLPGPPEVQRRKLALLADIRRLAADPGVEQLDAEPRRTLRENLPPADLHELAPRDLPPLARRPFTEKDGTVGRVLLTYHNSPEVSMWNGRDLIGIASVLEHLTLEDGTVIESSGAPMIFGAMLRSILHDGPLATALSLLGVVLVVALFLRPPAAAAAAIGALLTGVLWMVGAAGLLGVRITFLNFIALPITFGVGVEYAVNLVARLRQGGAVRAAVTSTGRAVALCSWTTIVGYGSLLAARSRALRGFGAMAVLGEIACVAAAVVALPAFIAWRRGRPAGDGSGEIIVGPGKPGVRAAAAGSGEVSRLR